jgi:hypothetical protein
MAVKYNFSVKVVSGSSRRNPSYFEKHLKEASQSEAMQSMSSFFNMSNKELKGGEEQVKTKAQRVIVFEDVDVVFRDEPEFLSSLIKLISNTKVPIILTTSPKG